MGKILSVIIPSYNMEHFLPKCIGSCMVSDECLRQAVEIIVVNDGSRDATSRIAHEWEAKHPNVVRVLDKENGNYGSCINAALPLVCGTFVKILDADDHFDTAAFQQFLTILQDSERNEECVDLFLSDFVWVDDKDNEKKKVTCSVKARIPIDADVVDGLVLLYMHSIAYRTSLLRTMGYRQTEGISYTDNEWACYPMAGVHRLRYEPLAVYRYLVGREGQTIDPKVRARSFWMRVIIANRMVENFGSLPQEVSIVMRDYIENFELMIVTQLYNTAILELPTLDMNQALLDFDKEFERRNKSMHDLVMVKLRSKAINFSYGLYWRRHRCNTGVILSIFRLYLRLVVLVSLWRSR